MARNKEGATSNTDSLPNLDVQNDEITADKFSNNISSNNEEQSGIELSESDLQLQVTTDIIVVAVSKLYCYYKRCIYIFYVVEF